MSSSGRRDSVYVTVLLVRHDVGLRSKPRMFGSVCIKVMNSGQTLRLVERINTTWCYVATLDGYAGYVLSHRYFVEPGHRRVKKRLSMTVATQSV